MGKKLFKLLIVGIFVFLGFGITVDAISTPYNGYLIENSLKSLDVLNTQATLTVTGVDSNDTFQAYKILDVYYNSETNEMLYGFTESIYNFLYELGFGIDSENPFTVDDYFALTSGDITSGSTISSSTMDAMASDYAAYIKQNSITGLDMTVSSSTASLTTAAGGYLILPTKTSRVYAVMVGNLDMYADGTEWKVNNETIVAKVSDVDIKKEYTDTSGNFINAAIIGRDFIAITKITGPIYPTNATNKKLAVTETLDVGFTFGGLSTMKIEAGGETYTNNNSVFTDSNGDVVATATFIDQVLTIEFNADYIYTPNIIISYTARLNEKATVGFYKNYINSDFIYSNDPYGTGTTIKNKKKNMDTYGIQIYKYDIDDNSPLTGAVFEIYADDELTDLIGTITTDETGIGRFAGVDGKVYLKETKAPTGYKLLRDIISVSELEISIEDEVPIEVPNGYQMKYIANEKMGLLPVTGGIGTVIFTIVGLMTIVGSICFITIYKSKKNNENFQV